MAEIYKFIYIRVVFYFSAVDIRDQVLNEDLYDVYSEQEAREIRAKMPHSIVNTLRFKPDTGVLYPRHAANLIPREQNRIEG